MALVNGIVAPELKSEVVKVNREDAAGEAHARAAHLLGSTLSADGAVRVALLNNKGLQASYNELGIAEAAMVEASLPPNPTFSLCRIQTPVELDIERRIIDGYSRAGDAAGARRARRRTFTSGAVACRFGNAAGRFRDAPRLLSGGRGRCACRIARASGVAPPNLPPSSPRSWARPAP